MGFVSRPISKREAEPYVLPSDDEEEKKEPQLSMINTCDDAFINEFEDVEMNSPKTKQKRGKGKKKEDGNESTEESKKSDDESEESDPEPEWLDKVLN